MTDTEPRMPAQASSSEPAQPHDVFVSYSRADREVVVELVAGLQARGLKAWVDLEDIPPSAEWMAEIRAAIEASDGYLVVVSPSLAGSEVCAEELELARQAGKRIVPVMVRPTDPGSVPATLAALNWIDATDGALDGAVDRAVEALRTDLDHVRAHTRLGVRAAEWERKGDTKALLLRGAEIPEAEAVVASGSEPRATPVQARYLHASRSAATRRQRSAIGAVAAALVVSLALSAFALVQRSQAIGQERVAESGRLAALAQSQLQIDPEVALLLSLRSIDVSETAAGEQALRRSLLASHVTTTLSGHSNPVLDASFSPDGTTMMSRSDWIPNSGFPSDSSDYSVRLWDSGSGGAVAALEMDTRIIAAAFDPEGEHIVAAGSDGQLVVQELTRGDEVATVDVGEPLQDLAVGAGGHVVTLSADETTRFWSVDTDEIKTVRASPTTGLSVVAVALGKWIATAGNEGVAIWNPRTLERVADIPVPFAPETLSVDGRGSRFLVSDGDSLGVVQRDRLRPVALWDLPAIGALDLATRTPSASPAISEDGQTVASARDDGQISLWDASSGQLLSTLAGHVGEVTSLEFGHDDSQLLSSGIDQQAIVWDVGTGEQVATFRGHQGRVFAAEFSPSGQQVVTAGFDRSARIWQVELNAPIQSLAGNLQSQGVALSSDGSQLATASVGGAALWDPKTGQRTLVLPMGEIPKDERYAASVSFSPDDRTVATTHSSLVRLWNASSGAPGLVIEMPKGEGPGTEDAQQGLESWVWAAVFSPDGTRLATGGQDGLARIWDASSGRLISSCSGHRSSVNSLAWSPDGSKLVTASDDGTVRIWNIEPCESSLLLRGHTGPVFSVDWSPTGSQILSTGVDATVKIWDATDGSVEKTLRGHTDIIINGDLSGDGRYYATASWDATIRVWEVSSGDVVAVLRGQGDQPVQITFDSHGHYLAVGTNDRETEGFITELYECVTCADLPVLVSVARDRVTRGLSREEKDQFGLSG